MQEKIQKTIKCKKCSTKFQIMEKDIKFYNQISPKFNGKKFQIPTPTQCPNCRMQRRQAFRNERKIYRRKCDLTNKNIISIFSPDKPYKVYNHNDWWKDRWDPTDFGQDYDFSKTFFEQFKELDLKVPKLSLGLQNSENCDYTNDTGDSKNCYMSFRCHYCENAIHSYRPNRSINIVDSYQAKESENLYECFQCFKCQNSKYLYKCNNSHSSYFLYNCTGCSDCILCYNQSNAKYGILNKTYSKNEYKEKLNELIGNPEKFEQTKKMFFEIINKKIIFKNLDITSSENCIGNELINCSNCYETFMMNGCENSRYAWDNVGYKNSMDNYSGGSSEYVYETTASKNGYMNAFTVRTRESKNIYYSMFLFNSEDCFGCIGLRNKRYCILNKQYTKEEYEKLVSKIIESMQKDLEWGEFFPIGVSPFAYNETVANEYFPLKKEEALKTGFKWSDYEQPLPKVEKIIPAEKLPKNIEDIPDDILNWAIKCEISKKPFKIVAAELEFYRKHNLPIPKRHPEQRHLDRISNRNPRKLFDRKCDKCSIEMKTTYSPERKEIVYCEECYNKENY